MKKIKTLIAAAAALMLTAQLQAGDIVLRFDRQPINNGNLSSTMQRLGAGRTVEVDFLRDGAAMSLSLTLGARPKR